MANISHYSHNCIYLQLQRSNVCLELVLHVCKAAVLCFVCFQSCFSLPQLGLKLSKLFFLGEHLQSHAA